MAARLQRDVISSRVGDDRITGAGGSTGRQAVAAGPGPCHTVAAQERHADLGTGAGHEVGQLPQARTTLQAVAQDPRNPYRLDAKAVLKAKVLNSR